MISKKISSLGVKTTLEDGDLITKVGNGENKNVTFATLKDQLGVTGTLTAIGDGVPVLDEPTPADYRIRAIESGAGVIASVSVEDGISLAWNVDQATGGVPITDGVNNTKPVLTSLFAGDGISITKTNNITTIEATSDPATGLANRIVVTQASDFSGSLDSTKEYFIDGVIDMGSQMIEVPVGGLSLAGYNFDISKLISSEAGYTMFTSPVGGSGDIIGMDYAIEVTGAGSQVYDITDATGFHAFEFSRINYNDCESLGSIDGYRQGLEVGTGRFGGKPQLELIGTWIGGYFIDTSIVRGMADGAYSLFKAGAGFTMASRFRSNMNLDLPTSASFFDFSATNFANPSTLQITGAIITRNGVANANDINLTPNIDETELPSAWDSNLGLNNTFTGGRINVTSEAETAIASGSTFYTLNSAAHTASELQHFDNPADMQLRHLGIQPRSYKISGQFTIAGTSGDVISVRVTAWDDSESVFVNYPVLTRQINSLVGGRDVAFFSGSDNIALDQNDYMFFEVANNSGNNNISLETDSYFIVEER